MEVRWIEEVPDCPAQVMKHRLARGSASLGGLPRAREPARPWAPFVLPASNAWGFLTKQPTDGLFVSFYLGSWNTFGKGENSYTPMHSIISGLLGFVSRLSKLWIHFSLLLANVYKYISEAKWICSLLEPNKHQTRCPYRISQSK